jgi:hypothetical protein
MSSGLLGKAAPAANTDTTLYTVPAGTYIVANLSVVNRGTIDAKVMVALAPAAVPTNADWIEFDAIIPANGGVLERSAIMAETGERVVVRDDQGTCSYRLFGIEKGV